MRHRCRDQPPGVAQGNDNYVGGEPEIGAQHRPQGIHMILGVYSFKSPRQEESEESHCNGRAKSDPTTGHRFKEEQNEDAPTRNKGNGIVKVPNRWTLHENTAVYDSPDKIHRTQHTQDPGQAIGPLSPSGGRRQPTDSCHYEGEDEPDQTSHEIVLLIIRDLRFQLTLFFTERRGTAHKFPSPFVQLLRELTLFPCNRGTEFLENFQVG